MFRKPLALLPQLLCFSLVPVKFPCKLTSIEYAHCSMLLPTFAACMDLHWPSPSPSNQSSKFEGAQFLIVFSYPTGQAALVWLSGFGFSSGPSQESTWGVLFGSMRNPYLCIPMRKQQPSDRGPSCPFPFRSCTFLTASERSLTSTSSRSPVF